MNDPTIAHRAIRSLSVAVCARVFVANSITSFLIYYHMYTHIYSLNNDILFIFYFHFFLALCLFTGTHTECVCVNVIFIIACQN